MASITHVQAPHSMENPYLSEQIAAKEKFQLLSDVPGLEALSLRIKGGTSWSLYREGYYPLYRSLAIMGLGYLAGAGLGVAVLGRSASIEKIFWLSQIPVTFSACIEHFVTKNSDEYHKAYTTNPYKEISNRLFEEDGILQKFRGNGSGELLIEPYISPIPPHDIIYEKQQLDALEKQTPGYIRDMYRNRGERISRDLFKPWAEAGLIVNARIEHLLNKEIEHLPPQRLNEEKKLEKIYVTNAKLAHNFYLHYYDKALNEAKAINSHHAKHFSLTFGKNVNDLNWDLNWRNLLDDRLADVYRLEEIRKSIEEYKKEPF